MKEALRTSGTSSRAQAGALGMFGADSILIRVPVLVGGRLPTPVSIVALIVEEEVRAPRIEILCEGLLTVGSVQVGVYLLEGWGQGGLVEGGIARERALLERARGVRGACARGATGTYGKREDELFLPSASVGGGRKSAGDLLTEVTEVNVQGGELVVLASELGVGGGLCHGREGRGGCGGCGGHGLSVAHGCGVRRGDGGRGRDASGARPLLGARRRPPRGSVTLSDRHSRVL